MDLPSNAAGLCDDVGQAGVILALPGTPHYCGAAAAAALRQAIPAYRA
jgi:hypothetical protein